MEQDRVIALGFFDGVHRGHQAILNQAAELARQGGLEVAAVTFETHPRAYVRGRAPDLVCSFARRCALLQQNGAGLSSGAVCLDGYCVSCGGSGSSLLRIR